MPSKSLIFSYKSDLRRALGLPNLRADPSPPRKERGECKTFFFRLSLFLSQPQMSSSSRNSRSVNGGRVTAASCHHNHQLSSPSSSPYYSYYYYNSSLPSASSFASTTSSFGSSSRSTSSSSSFHYHHSNSSSYSPGHHHHYGHSYNRSTSPTRVNFVGSVASAPSVRFSLDPRSISPGRSFPAVHHHHNHQQQHPHSHQHRQSSHVHHPIPQQQRRTCMCSPTTHPGSFRCSLHKNIGYQSGGGHHHLVMQQHSLSAPSNRLNARRSAMTNSLVRIGTVEGDLVKRALAALIRPSSHQQRRRAAFQRRPSRLSIMSCAGDDDSLVVEV